MRKFHFLFAVILFSLNAITAQVVLPKLISDAMVLQRETELKIWGWAEPGEKVQINFLESVYTTTTKEDGKWQVLIPAQQAGGPYKMTITGKNSIELKDILIGEVWVCSGQSNMAYLLKKSAKLYQKDIDNSDNPYIRQFTVPKTYNFKGKQDKISNGQWKQANEKTVGDFSAVAYFFGRELYEAYKIPIGLIDSSVGGTPAEAWISSEGLKEYAHYSKEIEKLRSDSYVDSLLANNEKIQMNWNHKAFQQDLANAEGDLHWKQANYDDSSWESHKVPGSWVPELGYKQGIVWYRKQIDLKAVKENSKVNLRLGRISDADSVFVNGKFVGATTNKFEERNYWFDANLLKEGENTIAVKVMSYRFNGGFIKSTPMVLKVESQTVDLATEWNFKLGIQMKQLQRPLQLTRNPGGLFNAMIAPILNYKVRGVIWYQGEGNTMKSVEYRTLFPALIKDWRNQFKNPDLPFLFVQLANFQKPVHKPGPSSWAMLREAQLQTLKLSYTGMAVAIDIGEANDIHPKNKKDVGIRLALNAQKIAYGNSKIISAGPVYKSMKIEGNKIILSFDTQGADLKVRRGELLQEFAIAGENKKFEWAKAHIVGSTIVVYSENILKPIAVRYAWSHNPSKANLINHLGLPATPFRTDSW